MSEPGIISLADIQFSYNGRRRAVLQDFALEIPAGAVTAILGPNGSGKTTLLHLILGLLTPQAGTIQIAGQPRAGYSRREMGQLVGLVPQDEYNPFGFSVLEYVLLGRAPYLQLFAVPKEPDRQAALDALDAVGLRHLGHRPIPHLSGGERQLVTVARALAQRPRILLLDEPTAHLDLGNKGRILQIMRDLATASMTVVFTTHDPNAAAAVANFVVLMRAGQAVAAGPAGAVLTAENLSATYGVPVEVLEAKGRRVIVLP